MVLATVKTELQHTSENKLFGPTLERKIWFYLNK